jgi:hypothetical protein
MPNSRRILKSLAQIWDLPNLRSRSGERLSSLLAARTQSMTAASGGETAK